MTSTESAESAETPRDDQSPAGGPKVAHSGPREGRITHSCGVWWTGLRTAHCAACHRTFVSVNVFDKHRNHDYETHPRGACYDPVDRGLVERERVTKLGTYTVWGEPAREGGAWWAR